MVTCHFCVFQNSAWLRTKKFISNFNFWGITLIQIFQQPFPAFSDGSSQRGQCPSKKACLYFCGSTPVLYWYLSYQHIYHSWIRSSCFSWCGGHISPCCNKFWRICTLLDGQPCLCYLVARALAHWKWEICYMKNRIMSWKLDFPSWEISLPIPDNYTSLWSETNGYNSIISMILLFQTQQCSELQKIKSKMVLT